MHPRPLRARRHRTLLPLAAVAVLATGCSRSGTAPTAAAPSASAAPPAVSATPSAGSPTPAASSAAPAPASAPTITIAGFDYDVPASVPAGGQVQVVNEDAEAHTVTLRGGDAPLVVQPGSTATLPVPSRPGTLQIVCDFHGGMTGTLEVR